MSSASFDLRTDELDSFIFLHEMLLRHIDFGVIYMLDHPFCSASGVPGPGDHRYVYYLRTQSTSGVHTLHVFTSRAYPRLKMRGQMHDC